MSLAMFAAPFDDNIEGVDNNSDNILNKKRLAHNRTQKTHAKESFDTKKVNSVLEKIYKNLGNGDEEDDHDDEDDDDDHEDEHGHIREPFNPPPKAVSAGVQRTIPKKGIAEPMINMTSNNDVMFRTLGRTPQPNYENTDNLDLNDYNNYGDSKTNEEYYKKVIPGYKGQQGPGHVNKAYYNAIKYNSNETLSQDVLLQKLNYMITLLEEQQDERTNNVTEEVVLYSFLGIFIIFIADTFVRAGKYVR